MKTEKAEHKAVICGFDHSRLKPTETEVKAAMPSGEGEVAGTSSSTSEKVVSCCATNGAGAADSDEPSSKRGIPPMKFIVRSESRFTSWNHEYFIERLVMFYTNRPTIAVCRMKIRVVCMIEQNLLALKCFQESVEDYMSDTVGKDASVEESVQAAIKMLEDLYQKYKYAEANMYQQKAR